MAGCSLGSWRYVLGQAVCLRLDEVPGSGYPEGMPSRDGRYPLVSSFVVENHGHSDG